MILASIAAEQAENTQDAPTWMLPVLIAVIAVAIPAFILYNRKANKARARAFEQGKPVNGAITMVSQLSLNSHGKEHNQNTHSSRSGGASISFGGSRGVNLGRSRHNDMYLDDYTSGFHFIVEYTSPFTGEDKSVNYNMNWQQEFVPDELFEYAIPRSFNRSGITGTVHLEEPYPVQLYVLQNEKNLSKEIIAVDFGELEEDKAFE